MIFIVHPVSNCFIDNLLPVWREAYRVLKRSGTLISGFGNPIQYIFDLKEFNNGNLIVKHKIPYSDIKDLTEQELKELIIDKNEGICLAGVISRNGKKRSDTAIHHFHDEKFNKRFIGFCKGIINFNKTGKIRIIDLHKKHLEKTFFVIDSRRKMNNLIQQWRNDKSAI